MLGEAIVDIKTSLMTEVGNRVQSLEAKTAEVASEKKAKECGASSV